MPWRDMFASCLYFGCGLTPLPNPECTTSSDVVLWAAHTLDTHSTASESSLRRSVPLSQQHWPSSVSFERCPQQLEL
jgi:hypothetical protein